MIKQDFANNLFQFMEETFEANITAFIWIKAHRSLKRSKRFPPQEASIPVGGKCASLAAQVAHVTFYIESFERYCAARRQQSARLGLDLAHRGKGHT